MACLLSRLRRVTCSAEWCCRVPAHDPHQLLDCHCARCAVPAPAHCRAMLSNHCLSCARCTPLSLQPSRLRLLALSPQPLHGYRVKARPAHRRRRRCTLSPRFGSEGKQRWRLCSCSSVGGCCNSRRPHLLSESCGCCGTQTASRWRRTGSRNIACGCISRHGPGERHGLRRGTAYGYR